MKAIKSSKNSLCEHLCNFGLMFTHLGYEKSYMKCLNEYEYERLSYIRKFNMIVLVIKMFRVLKKRLIYQNVTYIITFETEDHIITFSLLFTLYLLVSLKFPWYN